MNISGIRTYAGFYDYNTIKNQEAKNQQIEDAKLEENHVAAEQVKQQEEEITRVQAQTGQDSGAIDYANQYQPDVTYELKGADSDIANLDVEKAISDMEKDQILMQYQFFVGESKMGELMSANRPDENFFL